MACGAAAWIAEAGMKHRIVSRAEAADDLREQAASCRRLAKRANTSMGTRALNKVADYFDSDARRIDLLSEPL
jgi:hypothetical protein